MHIIEEYKFCLNIIKIKKNIFNAFDVISLLEIYFNKITFYPIVSEELNKYSRDLGIVNITKNNIFVIGIRDRHNFLWEFNK